MGTASEALHPVSTPLQGRIHDVKLGVAQMDWTFDWKPGGGINIFEIIIYW